MELLKIISMKERLRWIIILLCYEVLMMRKEITLVIHIQILLQLVLMLENLEDEHLQIMNILVIIDILLQILMQ